MKDGILVDGQELDIAEYGQDSDFFGEKVSVRNWVDDNCKKQDGWIEIDRGSKTALMLDIKKMHAVRVMSAGTTDFKRYEDRDYHKLVAWLQKNSKNASSFTYGPTVLINKHGMPVKKGSEKSFDMPKTRHGEDNSLLSNVTIFCEREEEERMMSNVCPKCFMLKANGHCECDFD